MEPFAFDLCDARAADFDEYGYLSANPDVALAVARGVFRSGREHYRKFGHTEPRQMRKPRGDLAAARRAKLDKLRPHLRRDMPARERNGKFDYLTEELRQATRITAVENVSGHDYDNVARAIIDEYRYGLVLDCGAGRRDIYFPNVVNFEIVDYDSTDVIGVGESLPFLDNTFDAVISVAVLEHVRDPFRAADEISRVLKPGGRLFCCMPFLQPVHGYPHHYFNATPQGLKRLFEDKLTVGEPQVFASLHPVWALSWILNSWARGLSEETRATFERMTAAELMRPPGELLQAPFAASLPAATQLELACGSGILAVKPGVAQGAPAAARPRGLLRRIWARLGGRA